MSFTTFSATVVVSPSSIDQITIVTVDPE